MSLSRFLPRRLSPEFAVVRSFSTTPTVYSSSSSSSLRGHSDFIPPSTYIGSWDRCRNPKEAAAKLALLRREYDRKFKEMRKEYIKEMEMQQIEKLRKDEARKEALRIANVERKAAKDAKKKAEAIERQAAEQEFRKKLMKERAEKLELWRARGKQIEEKKKEKNELLRRQSSLWIDEPEIVERTLLAVPDPMKERAEKLELWRARGKQIEEKKKEKNELLRRQSSLWIDEPEIVERTLLAVPDPVRF